MSSIWKWFKSVFLPFWRWLSSPHVVKNAFLGGGSFIILVLISLLSGLEEFKILTLIICFSIAVAILVTVFIPKTSIGEIKINNSIVLSKIESHIAIFFMMFSLCSFLFLGLNIANTITRESEGGSLEKEYEIQRVIDLSNKLQDVEVIWERSDESANACSSIRRDSIGIGNQLSEIDNENLNNELYAMIEKYRSAQYSFIIASDVECEWSKAQEYAEKSLDYGALALDKVAEAKGTTGEYGNQLNDWLHTDFTEERIYFHQALGYALLHGFDPQVSVDEVKQSLSKVSEGFYTKEGVDKELNGILAPVLYPESVSSQRSTHPCKQACKD